MEQGYEVIAVIKIKPLTSLSFRKAYPFGITQRGPVSASRSYVMKITTLLGAIAYVGYLQDPSCVKDGDDPLESLKSCVQKLCTLSLRGPFSLSLRGPFLWYEQEIFFGEERPYPLCALISNWDLIKDKLEKLLKGDYVLERKKKALVEISLKENAPIDMGSFYGNKLLRNSKTVGEEGGVYLRERVYYKPHSVIFFEGECNGPNVVIPLGGDGGVAEVSVSQGAPVERLLKGLWGGKWDKEVERAVLLIASPLILRDGENPLKPLEDIADEVEPIPLLRRYTVDVYPLGWDLRKDRPRPFCPAILPGSAAVVKGLSKTPRKLYEEGLGKYKELGFGTVLPLPF